MGDSPGSDRRANINRTDGEGNTESGGRVILCGKPPGVPGWGIVRDHPQGGTGGRGAHRGHVHPVTIDRPIPDSAGLMTGFRPCIPGASGAQRPAPYGQVELYRNPDGARHVQDVIPRLDAQL